MRGKRAVTGLLAAFVTVVSLVVVPALYAAPNDPAPKTSGEHIAYTFCHRTGSVSNPFVAVTADDAAWAEAHHAGFRSRRTRSSTATTTISSASTSQTRRAGRSSADECDGKDPPPDPKG